MEKKQYTTPYNPLAEARWAMMVWTLCLSLCVPRLAAQGQTYTETVNGVSFKMVFVEGGVFKLGTPVCSADLLDPKSLPADVTMSSYHIAETEVTQALWRAVMGENLRENRGCGECPMEKVSWIEAKQFIKKLNALTGKHYDLPTRAQWEFAAMGGNTGVGPAEPYEFLFLKEWKVQRVKSKKPNGLGLYDMPGNVHEWCLDWEEEYNFSEPVTDPSGPVEPPYTEGDAPGRFFCDGIDVSTTGNCWRLNWRGGIGDDWEWLGLRLVER